MQNPKNLKKRNESFNQSKSFFINFPFFNKVLIDENKFQSLCPLTYFD